MNFQDIIHEVYDGNNKQLRTSGGAGNATIFAVVNTGAAVDSTNKIGFATVAISTPTLYAVVNTGAAGQASVVLDSGKNYIGLTTTTISNSTLYAVVNTGAAGIATVILGNPTLYAVVNTPSANSTVYIGTPTLYAVVNTGASASINGDVRISGNVTLSDPKGFVGLVSVSGFANPLPVTGTFFQSTQPVNFGNVTLSPSVNNIGFATVAVSTPTLYAVVNTSAAATGNVTLDDGSLTGIVAGINSIGFATVQVASIAAGVNYIGSATVQVVNIARTVTGNITLSDSKTFIGCVTADIAHAWANPNTFIGLTTSVNGVGTSFMGLVTAYVSSFPQLSFYQQASLVSGYKYYGNAAPGSNPTTAVFKIQRESLNTGDVLFGGGAATFVHSWSAASLASLTYS